MEETESVFISNVCSVLKISNNECNNQIKLNVQKLKPILWKRKVQLEINQKKMKILKL